MVTVHADRPLRLAVDVHRRRRRRRNLVDEKGEPKNLRQGLIVDAFATLGAGLFGSSSGTAYVESIAGIRRMGGQRVGQSLG